LEIIGHPVVGLLHPVRRDLDLEAFLAGGDVFNGDIHGAFQPKTGSDIFNPYLFMPITMETCPGSLLHPASLR
jgi:hypothetical protein